jgi:NADPH-dependent curcumin reductase CurA
MAPIVNRRVLFNEVPQGIPEADKISTFDTTTTIDLDAVPLNGGVLVKLLLISPDPYMRGRMRDPSVKSYVPAFKRNEPFGGYGITSVIRSENDKFKPGDKLYGIFDWQDYSVIPPNYPSEVRVLPNISGVPLASYLGINGMPGKTAYYGMKEYSKMKKGETIFVSTAAGAVGAVVCQLAKQSGLKVIASTGSDEKVDWLLKELGVDVAFNYKTTKTAEILQKEGPIDIHWDNVGGSSLEAAIDHSNLWARHILCGIISQVNQSGQPYGITNLGRAIGSDISINGFVVSHLIAKRGGDDDFYEEMPKLVANGQIKFKEHVTHGLENAAKALAELFSGDNFGKAIVIVSDA